MKNIFLTALLLISLSLKAQTSPNVTFIEGLAFENYTTTQLNSIVTKEIGDTYLDITKGNLVYWTGSAWEDLTGGGLSPGDQTKLNFITVTQAVDLDDIESKANSALQSYTETDPTVTPASIKADLETLTGSLRLDASAIQNISASETDPIFSDSQAFDITLTNKNNWNSAFGWGDHSVAGYSTGAHTVDTDTQLSNAQVSTAFLTVNPITDLDGTDDVIKGNNLISEIFSVGYNNGGGLAIFPSTNITEITGGNASGTTTKTLLRLGPDSMTFNLHSTGTGILDYIFNGNYSLDNDVARKKDVDAAIAGVGSGSGDVTGPVSSTDNAIVVFDGNTGKIVKNTALTINSSSTFLDMNGYELEMGGGNINGASGLQVNGTSTLGITNFGGFTTATAGFRISSGFDPTIELSYFPTANPSGQRAELFVDKESGDLYYDFHVGASTPLQLTNNGSLIGDGTGTDDQTAAEVPIADAGGNLTATDVEGALAELAVKPTELSTDTTPVLSGFLFGNDYSIQAISHLGLRGLGGSYINIANSSGTSDWTIGSLTTPTGVIRNADDLTMYFDSDNATNEESAYNFVSTGNATNPYDALRVKDADLLYEPLGGGGANISKYYVINPVTKKSLTDTDFANASGYKAPLIEMTVNDTIVLGDGVSSANYYKPILIQTLGDSLKIAKGDNDNFIWSGTSGTLTGDGITIKNNSLFTAWKKDVDTWIVSGEGVEYTNPIAYIYQGNNVIDPNNEQPNANGFTDVANATTAYSTAFSFNGTGSVFFDTNGSDIDVNLEATGVNSGDVVTITFRWMKPVGTNNNNTFLFLRVGDGWLSQVGDTFVTTTGTKGDWIEFSITGEATTNNPLMEFDGTGDDFYIDDMVITYN